MKKKKYIVYFAHPPSHLLFSISFQVIVCHCRFNQSYRRFSTRHHQLIPILGFGRRTKSSSINRHWLSGKGSGGGMQSTKSSNTNLHQSSGGNGGCQTAANTVGNGHHLQPPQRTHFNRHLAMNLENDMYYTVDFSDSQHSPLIH